MLPPKPKHLLEDPNVRRNFGDDKYWEERRLDEERVLLAYLNGVTDPENIAKVTGVSVRRSRNIIAKAHVVNSAKEIAKDVKAEVMKEKVPMLEEITSLTLTGVLSYLKEHPTPENAKEASMYLKMAERIDQMIRLELGKPTAITQEVKLSLQQTQVIFEELKEIDQVFEYPEIPVIDAPKEDA